MCCLAYVKPRKRGIRQRKGVPPLRVRRMPRLTTRIAADNPNRNRILLLLFREERGLTRGKKQTVGEFESRQFLPLSTLTRPEPRQMYQICLNQKTLVEIRSAY